MKFSLFAPKELEKSRFLGARVRAIFGPHGHRTMTLEQAKTLAKEYPEVFAEDISHEEANLIWNFNYEFMVGDFA